MECLFGSTLIWQAALTSRVIFGLITNLIPFCQCSHKSGKPLGVLRHLWMTLYCASVNKVNYVWLFQVPVVTNVNFIYYGKWIFTSWTNLIELYLDISFSEMLDSIRDKAFLLLLTGVGLLGKLKHNWGAHSINHVNGIILLMENQSWSCDVCNGRGQNCSRCFAFEDSYWIKFLMLPFKIT